MRVAVFTSNQPRHIALLGALTDAGHEAFCICEPKSFAPNGGTPLMRRYWSYVFAAERQVFGERPWSRVPTLACRPGEASILPQSVQNHVLAADRIVVFGSSYLKGPFADAMIERGALNLHVGLGPELRGSAPNFWAEYLGRPDLVGAQVQSLSQKLDDGAVWMERRVWDDEPDPFVRGMLAARLGIDALLHVLTPSGVTREPLGLTGRSLLKFSRYADFTEEVVAEYLARIGR